MSPMEELIYLCIKKGANNSKKLTKKTGKAPNYINTYLSTLVLTGQITTKCPTCENNGYYVAVE